MKKIKTASDILTKEEFAAKFRKFADEIEKGDIKILDIKHKHDRKCMGYNMTVILQITKELEELKKYTTTYPVLK